ncbi:MAG TPA: hypothetical protein VM840_09090 [Actinomycetota bacterium]|jgi:hypothetical protein|nr:hypothetical protein [Actinomycetota bacterium]
MTTKLCCAYLRVYQPLDAFTASERSAMERAVRGPAARTTAGLGPAPSLALVDAEEAAEVFTKVVEGETYACPGQLRLRSLLGMLSFERSLPPSAVGAFFTNEELAVARTEIAALEAELPLRAHLIQSPWHVPLRWFVAFDDSERRMEHDGDHPRLRYETAIVDANERIARTLDVLRTAGAVHPGISGMVYELAQWLAGFDPRAVIELDYASVSTLFSEEDLADDHTATEISCAIQALAEGDGMRAALYYQRAGSRWQQVRALGSLN